MSEEKTNDEYIFYFEKNNPSELAELDCLNRLIYEYRDLALEYLPIWLKKVIHEIQDKILKAMQNYKDSDFDRRPFWYRTIASKLAKQGKLKDDEVNSDHKPPLEIKVDLAEIKQVENRLKFAKKVKELGNE